jgi:hypothetical protein
MTTTTPQSHTSGEKYSYRPVRKVSRSPPDDEEIPDAASPLTPLFVPWFSAYTFSNVRIAERGPHPDPAGPSGAQGSGTCRAWKPDSCVWPPDVAIVGEVRDREALPLLLTLSSGGAGLHHHPRRLGPPGSVATALHLPVGRDRLRAQLRRPFCSGERSARPGGTGPSSPSSPRSWARGGLRAHG